MNIFDLNKMLLKFILNVKSNKYLMKKKYILTTIYLVLGIVISMQFKTVLILNTQKNPHIIDEEILRNKIKYEKELSIDLKTQIDYNEKNSNDLLNSYLKTNNDELLKKSKIELDNINKMAGLVDVEGPGVIITLKDATYNKNGVSNETYLIHDSYIRNIVNELKIARAQAISINEERLISSSEQICAGPTIIINTNRYPAPYVIKAIGEKNKLISHIEQSDIVGLMRFYNIFVEIEEEDKILIKKFNGNKEVLLRGINNK